MPFETPEMKEMMKQATAPAAMPEAPVNTSEVGLAIDDLINNAE